MTDSGPQTIDVRQSSRWGPTLLATLKVNGKPVQATVDTGATVTILSQDFFKQLGITEDGNRFTVRLSNAEDGQDMDGTGGVVVKMEMGSCKIEWNVYVAPIRDDVLLVLDFLRAADVTIRARGALYVGAQKVQSQLINQTASYWSTPIRLDRAAALSPRREYILWATNEEPKPHRQGMVEPNALLDGVCIAATLVQMDSRVPVRVANFTDHKVTLRQGTLLGDVVEVVPERPLPNQDQGQPPPSSGGRARCVGGAEAPRLPEHLHDLYKRASVDLDEQQQMALQEFLTNYADVFAENDLDVGHFTQVQHQIDTGDARPIRQPPRRTPLGFQAEEEDHLKQMLDAGIIRPSQSAWASPVVLVRKKDGKVRWCVDYRRLNNVTIKDAYPIPKIDECLDTLRGASWFSTLDMQSGYWQVGIHPQDQPKTAFATKHGLYEFNRLSFGLCNAPGTFQRAMELVMRGLQWRTVLIYLDDVIVVAKTFDDQLDRLKEVVERFYQHGLKLKPRKCHLFQREVDFLGHVVNERGVHTNPKLIRDIQQKEPPRSLRELQAFLGLCNYYRRFVPLYAQIAYPLLQLTKKGATYTWGDDQQEAFDSLKTRLTEAPILAYPNDEGIFVLDTDASNHSVGAVLSQDQGNGERVIAYASAALTPAQTRYCVTRKELLAVVRFTRQFRHYLLGRKFRLRTDHGSLVWLFRFKTPEGQLARWLEELSQFNFDIEHRPGKKHGNADGMSRLDVDEQENCGCYTAGDDPRNLPCSATGCTYCPKRREQWERFQTEVDRVVPLALRRAGVLPTQAADQPLPGSCVDTRTKEDLARQQRDDPDLAPLFQWVHNGRPPKEEVSLESPALRSYWLTWSQILGQDGLLYYKWDLPGAAGQLRLLVPASMQKDLIRDHHDPPTAGHPGVEKTLGLLRQHYHWHGMRKAVEAYIQQCGKCAVNKQETQKRKAPLRTYQAGMPMERLHVDVLGPFPQSARGNHYILAAVDQFTKWAEVFAVPDQTAETTAKTLVNDIIARFGAPLSIHTDQGRNFESQLFAEVCRLLEVAKTRTTPYHPSSNGQVERLNRTLLQMMRCYISPGQRDWDEYLPLLASAYRRVPHSSTGISPNRMMLGRETLMPQDLGKGLPEDPDSCDPDGYVTKLQHQLESTQQLARQHLKGAVQRQKRDHNLRASFHLYQPGDLVYTRDNSRTKGHSPKLQPLWAGPAVVIERLGEVLYRIRDRKRTRTLHHDRLKPCRSDQIPLWVHRFRASHERAEIPITTSDMTAREDAEVGEPPEPPTSEGDPVEDVGVLLGELEPPDPPVPQGPQTRSGRATRPPRRYDHEY